MRNFFKFSHLILDKEIGKRKLHRKCSQQPMSMQLTTTLGNQNQHGCQRKIFGKNKVFFLIFSAFFPLWHVPNQASIFENHLPASKVHSQLATGQVLSETLSIGLVGGKLRSLIYFQHLKFMDCQISILLNRAFLHSGINML